MDPATIALLSGAMSAGGGILGGMFGGSGGMKAQNIYNKNQRNFLDNQQRQAEEMQNGGGYSQAMQQLMQYLNPSSEAFDQFSAPYMNQFNEQIVPGLAERFAGLGGGMGMGGLASSGFGQAIGGAGAGLIAQLAKLKGDMGNNAINSLLGQYNNLSQNALKPRKNFYSQDQGNASGLGQAMGGLFGNAIGYGSNNGWFGGGSTNAGGYNPQFGMTPGLAADFSSGAAYQPGYK